MVIQHKYKFKGKSVTWKGGRYKRKNNTWRNGKTGKVYNSVGVWIGTEPIRGNVYGGEKSIKRAGFKKRRK